MLKVCVVSQRVPFPPNKGEKLRTYHQVEYLVSLGYNVEVLSLCESEEDKRFAEQLAEKLSIYVSVYQPGSKLARYGWALLNNLPISVGAFRAGDLQSAINDRLNGNSDVMLLAASSLSHYVFSSPVYPKSNCKLLMDFMDVDSDKWRQYADTSKFPMNWVYGRESKGVRALEATTNQKFDRCFLIAQEEAKLFHEQVDNSKQVIVLGNGLDFDAFYPASKKGAEKSEQTPPNFLFTGVMDYKPNIDAVLWFVKACWPIVRQSFPTAQFTIAGMNPTDEIKSLNGKDGIEVTGFVDEILPYFHGADVFVAPFRLASGVQNKVLQAAACALPIVTTPMGAEGIHFANKETMWIEDNAEDFVNACIDAVSSSSLGSSSIVSPSKAQLSYEAIRLEYSWEQKLLPLKEALEQL